MRFLVVLMILISANANAQVFCMAKPKTVSKTDFQRLPQNLSANGILRLDLEEEPGHVTEVYLGKGSPFTGLSSRLEKVEDFDDRNFLFKWLKAKKLAPTRYYLSIQLRPDQITQISGIKNASIELGLRVRTDSGTLLRGEVIFNSYSSSNCQP